MSHCCRFILEGGGHACKEICRHRRTFASNEKLCGCVHTYVSTT